jgi:hypothetical protein
MSKVVNQADQYSNQGSTESRLAPRINADTVRAHGPRLGMPGVHNTNGARQGPMPRNMEYRRRANLAPKFY